MKLSDLFPGMKWMELSSNQKREYATAWRNENRSYLKDYRRRNKARISAYQRAAYVKHRDKIRTRSRAYYAKNSESIKAMVRKWRTENAAYSKEKKAQYRAKHREELAAKQLARYYANYDKHMAQHAEYRRKTRNEARAACRIRSEKITDGYAREMLSKNSTISAHEWPQALVEAKRVEILCMRMSGDARYKQAPSSAVVAEILGATAAQSIASHATAPLPAKERQ